MRWLGRYGGSYSLPMVDLIALGHYFFPRLRIVLVLYDFVICRRVLVCVVSIRIMQRSGVFSLCLYPLDASF